MTVVNLMNQQTQNEEVLTQAYKKEALERSVPYEYFDFHAHSKKGGFAALDQLIAETFKAKYPFGYFHEVIFTEKVGRRVQIKARDQMRRQNGVYRVNCFDSLDRTNVF